MDELYLILKSLRNKNKQILLNAAGINEIFRNYKIGKNFMTVAREMKEVRNKVMRILDRQWDISRLMDSLEEELKKEDKVGK
jgi:hypothetical protein